MLGKIFHNFHKEKNISHSLKPAEPQVEKKNEDTVSISSLARTGLNAMSGIPSNCVKEARSVNVGLPFLKAIEEQSKNPVEVFLAKTPLQIKDTESNLSKYAALTGVLTTIATGITGSIGVAIGQTGLTALKSVKPELIICKDSIGVSATRPLLETLEEHSTDPTEKLLAETANKVTDWNENMRSTSAAFKGVFTVLSQKDTEEPCKALAKSALMAIDSINPELTIKEAYAVRATQPFMDAIEMNADNPTARLLAETANKVIDRNENKKCTNAAFKGVFTVLSQKDTEDPCKALAKSALLAIDSIDIDSIIIKESYGVRATEPFMDAIEMNADNPTVKLLVETARKIKPSEYDRERYAAYKNVFREIAGEPLSDGQ